MLVRSCRAQTKLVSIIINKSGYAVSRATYSYWHQRLCASKICRKQSSLRSVESRNRPFPTTDNVKQVLPNAFHNNVSPRETMTFARGEKAGFKSLRSKNCLSKRQHQFSLLISRPSQVFLGVWAHTHYAFTTIQPQGKKCLKFIWNRVCIFHAQTFLCLFSHAYVFCWQQALEALHSARNLHLTYKLLSYIACHVDDIAAAFKFLVLSNTYIAANRPVASRARAKFKHVFWLNKKVVCCASENSLNVKMLSGSFSLQKNLFSSFDFLKHFMNWHYIVLILVKRVSFISYCGCILSNLF